MRVMSYCCREIQRTDESTLLNVMAICVESHFIDFWLGNEKQCEYEPLEL